MTPLHDSLRKLLEKTIIQARDLAETGSLAALERLGVGQADSPGYLSEQERELRVQLRARARQLGDPLVNRVQGIERLVGQCAYELWHRMLFARFLAENGLLMHPDGIPVTLEECGELAAEEGIQDAWTLVTQYASRMLPQIFRPEDPVLQVRLATEQGTGAVADGSAGGGVWGRG
ncbi:MAG: hypothetical protein HC924_13975 [Synechococcaceae cyanobacterium SM2_3_2]|nr:hypothetical protein [Synechococcaceae cyanobacterium SM2_3_2]